MITERQGLESFELIGSEELSENSGGGRRNAIAFADPKKIRRVAVPAIACVVPLLQPGLKANDRVGSSGMPSTIFDSGNDGIYPLSSFLEISSSKKRLRQKSAEVGMAVSRRSGLTAGK
jgi:hypothetical protein